MFLTKILSASTLKSFQSRCATEAYDVIGCFQIIYIKCRYTCTYNRHQSNKKRYNLSKNDIIDEDFIVKFLIYF